MVCVWCSCVMCACVVRVGCVCDVCACLCVMCALCVVHVCDMCMWCVYVCVCTRVLSQIDPMRCGTPAEFRYDHLPELPYLV